MKNKNADTTGELFSEDPEENLRIENEILHLKLKAELGGELMGNIPLPTELENKFLKNILEYEHAFANTRQVKIFDFLGKPTFRKSAELNDEELQVEYEILSEVLKSKNIELDFSGEHDTRLKYAFITEELFEHETDDIEIPGLITHYIYEEFHPNHRSDIESRAIEFLEGWLDHQIDDESWELNESFILPLGTVFSKKEVLDKIHTVFAAYREFSSPAYSFDDITFELKAENQGGTGHVYGFISYDAILESGETIRLEGPFEFSFIMEYKWWSICYFLIPGFIWEQTH